MGRSHKPASITALTNQYLEMMPTNLVTSVPLTADKTGACYEHVSFREWTNTYTLHV